MICTIPFGIAVVSVWYYYSLVKTVTVKLPMPLATWLDQQARDLGSSKSALIRQALEYQRSKRGRGTCLDLMEDLCGCLRGPRDLSTHPKHMEGFGK